MCVTLAADFGENEGRAMLRKKDNGFEAKIAGLPIGARVKIHRPFLGRDDFLEGVLKKIAGSKCVCTNEGNFTLCAFDLSAVVEEITAKAAVAA